MPTAVQTTLDRTLADAKHRPTVGLDGAKHLIDLDEDYILSLIADGSIAWAWDIGLGDARREVRILRRSIDLWLSGGGTKLDLIDEATALALLLPPGHTKPFLTNGEIRRALNCVATHVTNLIAAGALARVKGTEVKRGPNGSALVTVTSFEKFILERRLTTEAQRHGGGK